MSHSRLPTVAVCLTLGVCCGTTWLLAADTQVDVRAEVKIPMRDGVLLAANIVLPKQPGKYPTILMRTPYGKGAPGAGRDYAQHGCVYVAQDCRGRGTSAGPWTPFLHERTDGEDTYQWIARQPWSNGQIGTTGGSYVGFTQWTSVPGNGSLVKASYTVVPLVDPYHDLAYPGGAMQLRLMLGWSSGTAGSRATQSWQAADWLRALPLRTADTAVGVPVPFFRDWVAHPHFDAYWQPCSIQGRYRSITTPMYTVGGWFDIFAKSALDHVSAVRTESQSPEARRHQHILVGPWTHGANRTRQVGDVDFGPQSLVDLGKTQTQWFGRWLKGTNPEVDRWPPFRIFVMGRNVWRDEQEWPLRRTRYTPYYFHSRGKANTLGGDGRLNPTPPGVEPTDRFVYDPDDPVPTTGGCNLSGPAGPRDQTTVERRPDVLVFTSDALEQELEVTGPVKVVLHAAATAPDTDWTAKLVDVWPDGRPIGLCDGIRRARYRESADRPTLIEPGKPYRYEIDLWVTSNVFLRGHRVRVEISSSNFPRFDRNPNTGHAFGADAERRRSTQTVYHDASYASHILLPVIAAAQ
jgi:putative CocE/NonD family hydrolase